MAISASMALYTGLRWPRAGKKGVDMHSSDRTELEQLRATALEIAQHQRGDRIKLLSLLRLLEGVHREIREELFQASLPGTRRELYQFLKEIEEQGGWPYIPRMSLQRLLEYVSVAIEAESAQEE